jgi:ABC-type glycerol-3-phosphate transport system permease component
MKVVCEKCGYEATKKDYECPNCKKKFRPRSVVLISIATIVMAIFNLSIVQLAFAYGIFQMKQWARKLLFVVIVVQLLWLLITAGFDFHILLLTENLIVVGVLLVIYVPIAIYLMTNDKLIAAFEFYGGKM